MGTTVTWDTDQGSQVALQAQLSKGLKVGYGELAFDNSYPTGGESTTFFNNTKIVLFQPQGGYVFDYDATNEKVLVYRCDNGDTVASGTVTPLVQVSNTADLSALSDVPFVAFGFD